MAYTKQENQAVFVLHTYPFKETSLIVELFTQPMGRVSVVAKGARRPRSSLRGMLQSFQLLQATWSGNQELKTLHSIEWSSALISLEGDALVCGFYMNELLLRLLPREDPHEKLFEYYSESISQLSTGMELAVTLRQFELRLLQECGYQVPLDRDINGNVIEQGANYFYEVGYGPSKVKKKVSDIMLRGKTLIDMATNRYDDAATLKQSKQLMRHLIAFYLGDKPLNSKKLFNELETD